MLQIEVIIIIIVIIIITSIIVVAGGGRGRARARSIPLIRAAAAAAPPPPGLRGGGGGGGGVRGRVVRRPLEACAFCRRTNQWTSAARRRGNRSPSLPGNLVRGPPRRRSRVYYNRTDRWGSRWGPAAAAARACIGAGRAGAEAPKNRC